MSRSFMLRRLPDRGNNIVDDTKEDEDYDFFSKANNNEGSNDLTKNNPEEKIFQSPNNQCLDDSMLQQRKSGAEAQEDLSLFARRDQQIGVQRRLFMDDIAGDRTGGVILQEEDVPFSIALNEEMSHNGQQDIAAIDYSQNKMGSQNEEHSSSFVARNGDDEQPHFRMPMGQIRSGIKPPQCPLTPVQNQTQLEGCIGRMNYLTFSPVPQTNQQLQIYKTLPEFGFSSKIFSAGKKQNRAPVPSTPNKKNLKTKKFSGTKTTAFCNAPLPGGRSAQKTSGYQFDEPDIYSPQTSLLKFSDTKDSKGLTQMKVLTIPLLNKFDRLYTEFEVIAKIGEGTFGEAFKVKSRIDGRFYAIKKAKERYMGYKDRESKLSEVYKALKITEGRQDKNKISPEIKSFEGTEEDDEDKELYRSYCVKVYEAWEESGHLYIQSELCEKGNLNDYLLELTGRNRMSDISDSTIQEWWQIITEDQVWKFLFEMTCALKHVHDLGFVHLDVKPQNFFVRECGSVALGDFGQALEIAKISYLKDDDVEGDSIFMAPELLQTYIVATKRISTKADIFSLGASLLEIATGINLPQNGVMWQKLRQAGEGVIRFSPSANRSVQLEQLISMMMEQNPEQRPSADEILLHPRVQTILNSIKDASIPSTTAQKQPFGQKRNLGTLNKLNLESSPILQKFKNPLSCRSDNVPDVLQPNRKNEMILISPRILLSAQKNQYIERHNQMNKSKKSEQLHKRPYMQLCENYDENDGFTCRKKRRRKSSIESPCHSSGDEMKKKGCFKYQQEDEVDEDGLPICLRTLGRSASFQGDENDGVVAPNIPYPSSQNLGLHTNMNDEIHASTTQSSKAKISFTKAWAIQQTGDVPKFSSSEKRDTFGTFKSSKRLLFQPEQNDITPRTKTLNHEDDFQASIFSPNDEGPVKPLLIFEHHGIKQESKQSAQQNNIDEAMEEELETPLSVMDTSRFNEPNKTLHFGGSTLIAPASKLQHQQTFKIPNSLRHVQSHEYNKQLFEQQQQLYQDSINSLQITKLNHQFSFNEKFQPNSFTLNSVQNNKNQGSGGNYGSNIFAQGSATSGNNDINSGSAGLSTPKLFRNQSSTSGNGCLVAGNSSGIRSHIGGFQMRGSNTSVFDNRLSALTNLFDPRVSNPASSLIDQRCDSNASASDTANFAINQLQRSSNHSSSDFVQPSTDIKHGTFAMDNPKSFQLRGSPRILNHFQAPHSLMESSSDNNNHDSYIQMKLNFESNGVIICSDNEEDQKSNVSMCSESNTSLRKVTRNLFK